MQSVFILGATGSIGGALLPLVRQEYPTANITALVRKDGDVQVLASSSSSLLDELYSLPTELGVESVKGSAEQLDLVTDLSSKADLIINAADADIFDAIKAILEGAKRRYEATGKKSTFIHTSGVAVVLNSAEGVFRESAQVYDVRPPLFFPAEMILTCCRIAIVLSQKDCQMPLPIAM